MTRLTHPPKTKETGFGWSCKYDGLLNAERPSIQDARVSRLYDVPLEERWVMLAKFVFRDLLIADFYPLVLESSKSFHSRGIDESHRLDIRTLIELQFVPPLITNLQALPPLARRL